MYGLLPIMCLTLAACGGKGKEPSGQVVATVDGDEITLTELRTELQGANLSDPKARKAAEQRALQAIINRKIAAKAAEEQKLDKTPQFALQEERALELMRANALQERIISSVPKPTATEISQFMTKNPDIFAQRKIFVVEQIRMPMPQDRTLLQALEPMKSLEEIEGFLNSKSLPFQRVNDRIDAVGNDPRLIQAIIKLPPGEVFVIPSGPVLIMNRVRETRVEPFTGEPANKYAQNMMTAQRTREAVTSQIGALIKKAEPTIKYNKQYQPPAATPAAKTAQPKA